MTSDITKPDPFISTQLLCTALTQKGYTSRTIELGETFVEMTSPSGWKWLTRNAYVYYPFTPLAATRISHNKLLSYNFAELHGAAIPATMNTAANDTQMSEFLEKYSPVIVKPLNSSAARGVHLNISTLPQLNDAVEDARRYSRDIVVQQQFQGDEIRFTVIDGKVVSCLLRQHPQVSGDGRSTIEQLITEENQARNGLSFPYLTYPQLTDVLVPDQLLHDQRVPLKGEVVVLGQAAMISKGASVYEVKETMHSSYIEVAEKLAAGLSPDFIVVDMLIADYTIPKSLDNYVFLEFSTCPALRLYYSERNGRFYDIVKVLADKIDCYGQMKEGK